MPCRQRELLTAEKNGDPNEYKRPHHQSDGHMDFRGMDRVGISQPGKKFVNITKQWCTSSILKSAKAALRQPGGR
jgi:hypothetical protein